VAILVCFAVDGPKQADKHSFGIEMNKSDMMAELEKD
jgi:hypothetical protein